MKITLSLLSLGLLIGFIVYEHKKLEEESRTLTFFCAGDMQMVIYSKPEAYTAKSKFGQTISQFVYAKDWYPVLNKQGQVEKCTKPNEKVVLTN